MIRRVWGRRGVRVHAPYATRYSWGLPAEAREADGANATQLLFSPAIDRDIHALFLKHIGVQTTIYNQARRSPVKKSCGLIQGPVSHPCIWGFTTSVKARTGN